MKKVSSSYKKIIGDIMKPSFVEDRDDTAFRRHPYDERHMSVGMMFVPDLCLHAIANVPGGGWGEILEPGVWEDKVKLRNP